MTGKFSRVFSLGTIFLMVLLLSIILMIFCIPLYIGVVFFTDISHQVNLSFGEIISEYTHLLSYLTMPWQSLELTHFTLSIAATQHFKEVRYYFLLLEYLMFMSCILGVLSLKWWVKTGQIYTLEMRLRLFRWYPVILIVFLPLGFNRLFVLMHQILFRNQYWIFNPKIDPIIHLFPPVFFLLTGIGIVFMYEGILCGLIWWVKKKEESFEKRE